MHTKRQRLHFVPERCYGQHFDRGWMIEKMENCWFRSIKVERASMDVRIDGGNALPRVSDSNNIHDKESESNNGKEINAIERQIMATTPMTDADHRTKKSLRSLPTPEVLVDQVCSNDDGGSQATNYPKEVEIIAPEETRSGREAPSICAKSSTVQREKERSSDCIESDLARSMCHDQRK